MKKTCAALLAGALLLTGCGSSSSSSDAKKDTFTVGMV